MKNPLVIDIETVGDAHTGRIVTAAWMTVEEERAHVEAFGHSERAMPWPADLLEMLADPERPTVSFTKYDGRFWRLQGLPFAGPTFDIQSQCWVDNENQSLSLDACARRYLHKEMDKRIKVRNGLVFFLCDDGSLVPVDEAPLDQLYRYNVDDTETERDLFVEMCERLVDGEWWRYWHEEEMPFTGVLLDMECRGMPIDMERSEKLREELEVSHSLDEAELLETAGLPDTFNLNSGPMMSAYLFHPSFTMKDALPCMPGEYNGMSREDKVETAQLVVDELGLNFTVGTVGRTYIHGVWTLAGRGLRGGPRTEKGDRFATNRPALKVNIATASDPWVGTYLDFRATGTLLSTYLRRFPERVHEGRIYGRFNQTGTKTGRLSSSEPNMQNMPSHGDLGPRVRDIFRAPAGRRLVVADASQLEPRLMAHFSQDPTMMAVYLPGGSGDIYVDMATGVFDVPRELVTPEQRNICKTLVLAMGYGAGDKKVGAILTANGYPTTAEQGAEYVARLREHYDIFFDWRGEVIARVKKDGYVQTIGGRHRRLRAQFVDRRNWKNVGYGERQAVNAIIQGSAADIMRRDMVAQQDEFPELALLAQVHDELVNEADEGWARADEYGLFLATAHGYDLNVPLVFEPHVGVSWHEAKEGAPLELPDGWDDQSLDFEEERSVA